MPRTQWTLAETLHQYGQKVPALAQLTGLSKNTIYDIVNGKSQAITLETVDKLLEGLEQLTGERLTLDAVLKRVEPEDPYAYLFAEAKPYDHAESRRHLTVCTVAEKIEDAVYWNVLGRERYQFPAKAEADTTYEPFDPDDFEAYCNEVDPERGLEEGEV